MLLKNDLEDNIAEYLIDRVPLFKPKIIFDVGANVGWFGYQVMKVYPDCQLYLFDPVSSLFYDLKINLERFPELHPFPRCKLINIALGHKKDIARISNIPAVTTNSIGVGLDTGYDEIILDTGDNFINENNIYQIDYLKIDTEGYDLKTLIGFEESLSAGIVKFIQVECSLCRSNTNHILLSVFEGYLSKFDYSLFRIINQASSGSIPTLTRADAVFISNKYAATYLKL